jgi:hypothetical protein
VQRRLRNFFQGFQETFIRLDAFLDSLVLQTLRHPLDVNVQFRQAVRRLLRFDQTVLQARRRPAVPLGSAKGLC